MSTSSMLASVAVFADDGALLHAAQEEAPRRSGAACIRMLQQAGIEPLEVSAWLADVGPGSFTGARVGVVLAATMAWTSGAKVAGADAFDLIAPDADVAIPNRRGEWLVRKVGRAPEIVPAAAAEGWIGYVPELSTPTFPEAARFAAIWKSLKLLEPHELRPRPLVPPSISTPRPAREAG